MEDKNNLSFEVYKKSDLQDFGRKPGYLQRMRAEAAEEARRWVGEREHKGGRQINK